MLKKARRRKSYGGQLWAQLGSNQRPPDYESGAANQLSYGPNVKTDCNISYLNVIMQAPHRKKIS